MFRSWDEQCKKTTPHDAHWTQRGFLWTDETFCRGVAKPNPWKTEIKETLRETQTDNQQRIAHRHFYKLTRFYKFPMDIHVHMVSSDRVGWQCECGSIRSRDRYELAEEMRPIWKNVDQVWPQ